MTGPTRRRSISQRRPPASHSPPALRMSDSNSFGQTHDYLPAKLAELTRSDVIRNVDSALCH
jgi:hypothetical protein